MSRVLSYLTLGSLIAAMGCGSTDVSNVDLSGTWQGTVNGLGIGAMTMTVVERNNEISVTGQWSPLEGGGPRTLTAQGLHFGVDINLAFRFSTATGTADYTTQGRVEDENSFHLVFPTEDSPIRVVFTR